MTTANPRLVLMAAERDASKDQMRRAFSLRSAAVTTSIGGDTASTDEGTAPTAEDTGDATTFEGRLRRNPRRKSDLGAIAARALAEGEGA